MKTSIIRRQMNFSVFRKHVWVDHTCSRRLIRIKHHTPGFIFGGYKYSKRLYKVRGLPKNWMEIAVASDFEPIERYPGIWDVFDKEVCDRHHDLYAKKWRAWLACYHAAVERAAA